MPARLIFNPIEVLNRLNDFDFSTEELLEVVGAMVAARNSCTENHPASAPGWYSWSEGGRRLREIGLMKADWFRDETNGVPAIINRKFGIKIAVCNTDDGTCRNEKDRVPQNRTKKGPATDRIAEENRQMILPGLEVAVSNVVPISAPRDAAGITVYYLCVYHEGDDVRAELSCPSETEGGYFSDFVERIFLIGGEDDDDGGVSRKNDVPGDDEFDIPVIRKS